MQRGRSGSSSSSPEAIFAGVRFVLFGFDSVSEAQYRSELIGRGGTDVGRYNSTCTHVIVCGRVYDDQVCVSAREDGKALVTELWIDDSLDFGMLADANRVLYRPAKDLNGIPGGESLCVCLTGYQRQEREDIMKMVSLMGARFSKPLIANQVTHLICYKFEGEKYELAKKVNIKLVNHRWLEDCLKVWEILPTDDYTKSGWELEILDAEARDSEEETEDPGNHALRKQSLTGTSSMQGGVQVCPVVEKSKSEQDIVPENPPHISEGSVGKDNKFSTPYKESTSGKALATYLNDKVLEASGHKDAIGIRDANRDCIMKDVVDGNEPKSYDANLNMEFSDLPSNLRTGKRDSPLSTTADAKLSNQSYSRKTSRKLVSAEDPSNILPSLRRNLEVSQSMPGKAKANHASAGIPSSPFSASTHHPEARNSSLPQKRKVGEKSPKSELQDSPSAKARYGKKETTTASPNSSIADALADIGNCSDGAAISNSEARQQTNSSAFKSLSYKRKSLKQGQPALDTKICNTKVSHSVGNKADVLMESCQRHNLHSPTNIPNKLAVLETMITGDASPTSAKMINDLVVDNQHETDRHPSSKSKPRTLGLSATGARMIEATSPKENSPLPSLSALGKSEQKSDPGNSVPVSSFPNDKTGADIAMSDIANTTTEEPEGTFTLQQEEGVFSPDSRDSGTRNLLSTASVVACKENDLKAAPVSRPKMISKRNFGSKKRSTGTSKKDEVVACLDRTTTSNQAAVEPEKVKAEQKLESKFSDVKNKAVEPASVHDMVDVVMEDNVNIAQQSTSETNSKVTTMNWLDVSLDPEKENKPKENGSSTRNTGIHASPKVVNKHGKIPMQNSLSIHGDDKKITRTSSHTRGTRSEPACFILSGHRIQRKEFQTVIRRLKGRLCSDSHKWSYQATHFIVPDPVRRTEKFFAAAAAGRWILKMDYLTASHEAGRFLDEEPFEWYRKGLTEDGAISLEAPRRWRLLRERTGHGALYGMRLIIYGDCIAPTLDTLKRVVKAGDGTILATSPPYSRFLKSSVDYAIISPGMPRADAWVQEFMRHEIPCVAADYLVEYVCKPGYSLERHVLYKTHAWAEKSFEKLLSRSEEVVTAKAATPSEDSSDDVGCVVCGSREMGEVMLICGDESGAVGCGIGTHIGCCDPPLEAVPEGDWLCPNCTSKSRTSKAPLKSRKLKSSTKRK